MTGDITILLKQLGDGDQVAMSRLFALVYDEFHALAVKYFANERDGHTLQPTALVHEAYLKMLQQTRVQWQDRNHFFAIGAVAMRRLLVDHARSRKARKRRAPPEFDAQTAMGLPVRHLEDVLVLDEALSRLAQLDAQQARVVELRFFAGLTVPEVAEAMALAPRTVEKEWTMAKAWLRRELAH